MSAYAPSPTTVQIVNGVAYVIAIGIILVAVVLLRLALRYLFVTIPQRRRAAKGLPPRTPRRYTIGGPR